MSCLYHLRIQSFYLLILLLINHIKKGLEFDDVILYNFFTDSELKEDTWNILTLLDISDEKLKEEDFKFQYDRIYFCF